MGRQNWEQWGGHVDYVICHMYVVMFMNTQKLLVWDGSEIRVHSRYPLNI